MGRLLGIDYGKKRIGLAVTDETRMIASPFSTQQNNELFWTYLSKLIPEYKIDGFVVGKPNHDYNNDFQEKVMIFSAKLHQQFQLPIYFQDESLTSKESMSFLIETGKRRKKLKQSLDQYAAQKILTEFLASYQRGMIDQFVPLQGESH
ncbi:MAG: Holliday junction resolvase RuvX [Brevinemataceae bacterium]